MSSVVLKAILKPSTLLFLHLNYFKNCVITFIFTSRGPHIFVSIFRQPTSDEPELTTGSSNNLPDMNLLSSCECIHGTHYDKVNCVWHRPSRCHHIESKFHFLSHSRRSFQILWTAGHQSHICRMDIKGEGVQTETALTGRRGLFQAVQTHAPWQEDSERYSDWTVG